MAKMLGLVTVRVFGRPPHGTSMRHGDVVCVVNCKAGSAWLAEEGPVRKIPAAYTEVDVVARV